jgi:hypothetical protein
MLHFQSGIACQNEIFDNRLIHRVYHLESLKSLELVPRTRPSNSSAQPATASSVFQMQRAKYL